MNLADWWARAIAPWVDHPTRLDIQESTMAVTQADLDGIVTNLRSLRDELTDSNSRIQKALADLAAANPNLDLSEVNAALADLTATVDNTEAIVPGTPGDGGTPQPGTDPDAGTGTPGAPAPADPDAPAVDRGDVQA